MNTPSDTSATTPCFKIISGGQTGADRAGLDVAIARGIPHGGWCPKGRKSEDGPLPARYLLTETPTASYLVRTERNVTESDATVIFTMGALSGGSKRTAYFAKIHGRPLLHLPLASVSENVAAGRLVAFVHAYRIKLLNVAGTRESKEPGIHTLVCKVLGQALDKLGIPDPNIEIPSPDVAESASNHPSTSAPIAESGWGLTVYDFCDLHARRHRHWAAVIHDPDVPESARKFLQDCMPTLKTTGSVIGDVLPSGEDLLTFLCQQGYSVRLSWHATRIDVHLAMRDVDLLSISGVHEFEPDGPQGAILGEKFDALVVKMILEMKYQRFD